MKSFFETMFFSPKWYHYPLIILLTPLSLIYGSGMFIRRILSSAKDFGIPIVSIGNLMVGGSGKTPFVINLASMFEGVTVISRGYGRLSSGLVEVSQQGTILVPVEESGDEAMLMAKSLPKSSVIVSEDRAKAIALAKQQGAKCIILDDGFNRVAIKKYEILLRPKCIYNYLPFPAGAFREFYFSSYYADMVLTEGKDFERKVEVVDSTERMVLLTAISNPQRLEKYLPKNVVAKMYLDDHAYFDKTTIVNYMNEHHASSLLCTSKDKVKLEKMDLVLSEMKLELILNHDIIIQIESYIKGYTLER